MDDFSWPTVLGPLTNGENITREQAASAVSEIMTGNATAAQTAAFLAALRTKKESAEEMAGMVDAMMKAAVTVDLAGTAVDIVGTGGDGFGTFNISTTAAFIAAGAGASVAKHGNRAASSKTASSPLGSILQCATWDPCVANWAYGPCSTSLDRCATLQERGCRLARRIRRWRG